MAEQYTASLKTKVVMTFNSILFGISLILYFVWRHDKVDGVIWSGSYKTIFDFYSFVVCWTFASDLCHTFFAFFFVERCKWKYQHISWGIHSLLYMLVYVIGASLLASKLDDMQAQEDAINSITSSVVFVVDLSLPLYKAVVAFGFISAVTSMVQLTLNYKDYKQQRDYTSPA